MAVTVLTLPVSAISRERRKDVGLVTQDWVGWLGDVAKGVAIEAVIVGAGGALLVFAHAALRPPLVGAGGGGRGRLRRRS